MNSSDKSWPASTGARQHDQIQSTPIRHWLLDAVYGRGLLKVALRKMDRVVVVPIWSDALHLDPMLDRVIDDLGLRNWQRPTGIIARLQYLEAVLHMRVAIHRR